MIDLICDYYAKDLEERPVRSQVEVRISSSISSASSTNTRLQALIFWCRLGTCETNKRQRRPRLARSLMKSYRMFIITFCQVGMCVWTASDGCMLICCLTLDKRRPALLGSPVLESSCTIIEFAPAV